MAQKVNLEVKGVIENMSWFTGDDGKRYELFGAGGGRRPGHPRWASRCSARCRWSPLREGGDAGRPIVVTEPDGEAAEPSSPRSPSASTSSSPRPAATAPSCASADGRQPVAPARGGVLVLGLGGSRGPGGACGGR